MKIIEIMSNFANDVPGKYQLKESLTNQPVSIKNAIEFNSNEALRGCISMQKFYANEVKVSVY